MVRIALIMAAAIVRKAAIGQFHLWEVLAPELCRVSCRCARGGGGQENEHRHAEQSKCHLFLDAYLRNKRTRRTAAGESVGQSSFAGDSDSAGFNPLLLLGPSRDTTRQTG
ncbi:hypothetical protein IB238_06535 [Rhizobium sp. ARZ01]|uniref:hypothetical protein n=1 Tax=Rhizobium sp. ARZ01 TaxID=2769313 RepID=UPI00177F09EA|nr:hypothetical protein [Rhizobium sp. ARZ01]MBD9372284.1 hypothetical protein [Rhizobium sp. ARZ01]